MKQIFLVITFLLVATSINSQPRIKYTINNNWKYHQGDFAFAHRSSQKGYPVRVDERWESVSLPHTWNARNPFDDQPGYYRGIGWYRKVFFIEDSLKGRKILLHFEGVNRVADVYVNGTFVGDHKGGYPAFTFDITNELKYGGNKKNLVAVKVDNSHDNAVPPLSVGYTIYGGIYGDVWLIATDQIHIDATNYGSTGVFISTPSVNKDQARVSIKTSFINNRPEDQNIELVHRICDNSGMEVLRLSEDVRIESEGRQNINSMQGSLDNPHLWSPEKPYLYSVYTEIYQNGKRLDCVKNTLGFRYYSFNPNKGFSLNGEPYIIKGTNRHQDYEGLGNALLNAQHRTDMEWIKKMGANFVRLAHYPQDPVVLQNTDRLGLLVWKEIPMVNYMNMSPQFMENAKIIIREMIRQHYNHPSVILCGSSNEIFLWSGEGRRAREIKNKEYMKGVQKRIKIFDSLIHEEDPFRLSGMAIHGGDVYDRAEITAIPNVLAFNQYFGWYGGVFSSLGNSLDRRHKNHLRENIFISEYGAGNDTRIHGVHPERFDFSANYARLYHESHIQQIQQRSWLAGTAIWNQFDFSQPHTGGTLQHLNQKGLQTWDRKPKDTYYLYKANWNPEPMVYIAKEWNKRYGWEEKDNITNEMLPDEQNIVVYSNLDQVELFHNDKSAGKKRPNDINKASWTITVRDGDNQIHAIGRKNGREFGNFAIIDIQYLSLNLDRFEDFGINTGFNAEFVDNSGKIWIPDREYKEEFYGHVNGEADMIQKDVVITPTKNRTPIFNYYLEGMDCYHISVPDGTYELTLYCAEPQYTMANKRIFSIEANEKLIVKDMDLAKEHGFAKAVKKTIRLSVKEMDGIQLRFISECGKPIINDINIYSL